MLLLARMLRRQRVLLLSAWLPVLHPHVRLARLLLKLLRQLPALPWV